MVFSSSIFLFFFIPLVIMMYYVCPVRGRNVVLLVASLFFYAWGEPIYILIMLFSTVFDYINGRILAVTKKLWKRRLVLIISVVGNLSILFFFKYRDFFCEGLNGLFGTDIGIWDLALPIGISFYTFQTMSYTIDVYRGRVEAQKNILNFAVYVCLFPQLIAGPIVRYRTIHRELGSRKHSFLMCYHGMQRFIIGLGKKVIFANTIGALWEEIRDSAGTSDMSVMMAWLGAVCFTLQIYFDFSGYSDMAIGLGRMFGFHFPENFKYPYESRSITEFWRRWHISMGTWFRDYLYIPLGGNRVKLPRQLVNLAIVWFLTGLWHGASWNYVLWGVYYLILLLIEKLFLHNLMKKWPGWIRHIYSLFFIVTGWVIFACEDLSVLWTYVKSMFGVGVPLVSDMGLYDILSYGLILVIMCVAATSLFWRVKRKIHGKKGAHAAMALLTVVILVLVVPMLIRESYNPFLYFRF